MTRTEKGCDHREGEGSATAKEIRTLPIGHECPNCLCTLGSDGFWYIEAEQAPK